MLFRQEPNMKNNDFLKFKPNQSKILHLNGFCPKYYFDGFYYFDKTDDLIDFIENRGWINEK